MSDSSASDVIDLLEQYLLAPDKDAFFATLVKGSGTYERLRMIDHLNRYGLKVPADTRASLEQLLKSPSDRKDTLASFKTQLLQISSEEDETERKKRLEKFNEDFLHCRFNHRRPANVEQSGKLAAGVEESGLPTRYECPATLSLESIVKSVMGARGDAEAWVPVTRLRSAYYHHYDLLSVLSQRGVEDFAEVFGALPSYTHVSDVGGLLRRYGEAWRAKHGSAEATASLVSEETYRKLTLEQIGELERAVPGARESAALVAAKFRKAFEAELDTAAQADAEPAARRATLARMLAWADALPETQGTLSLRAQVLREVLETDLEANRVDEVVFARYVASPVSQERGVYPPPAPGMPPVRPDARWYGVHRFPRARWHATERELVSACLQRLLADAARAVARLSAYEGKLERDFLRREYCRARLLSGAEAADAPGVFAEAELNALREERRLRFVPWNRRRFEPGERVDLLLEVKNVESVTVSVYEMDTESYYRDHGGVLDARVNVTGLIPSRRVEQALGGAPIVSRVVEFKDLFEARRGVYVVEFVGGGLSSRAVVCVGGLTAVRQVLSKGVLLHVVDEARRICCGETTGVRVDGRVMRAQEGLGGGILVPFGESAREEACVLVHEGFAEPYQLSVPAEDVRFNVGLLVNEESVALCGVVRLVLLPQVAVNGRRVGVAGLRKVRAYVTSVNEDLVSTVTTFDDVRVDKRGRGTALDYLVPPKTQRVEVRVTAEFYSSAREKYVEVSCERTIGVDGKRGQQVFYDYYVSPDAASGGADYVVELLGKNGEPYAKQRVEVELVPVYARESVTARCETDAEGRVRLVGAGGCVSEVHLRSVDAPSAVPVACAYELESGADEVAGVPARYDVVEGEALVLPLCQRDGTFDARRYELVRVARTDEGSVVADAAAQVRGVDGALRISGLTEGVYRFRYREAGGGKAVVVRVLRGARWEASPAGYMVTARGIRRLVSPGLGLSMRGYRLDAASGAAEVRVASEDGGSVEVHAFALSYYPRSLAQLRQQLSWLPDREGGEEFTLGAAKNQYLSEKRLGDEVRYVLERHRRKAYMGSTLEKPPGLLQRHFVRETAEDEEVLEDERDYTQEVAVAEAPPPPAAMMQCALVADAAPPMMRMARSAARHARMGYGGGYGMGGAAVVGDYTVTRLNGFLGSAGWSAVCCAPEEGSGAVHLQVPLDAGYSTLVLVARDSRGSVVETHALPVGRRPRVDVRLAESKSADRVYVQERVAHRLVRGEAYVAKDASSTDMRVVDDVATVLKVQRGVSGDSGLDEWGFLGEWASLSPRERLRKYDRYMCHELNVFAYFKDREFFEAVVRPHLASKTRRGVVDDFLLGDVAALEACLASPARVSALDVLERTLLVAALGEAHPAECAAIARAAREAVGPESERDPRQYERLFDSVLSGREPEADAAAAAAPEGARFLGAPGPMRPMAAMARAAPMGRMMAAPNSVNFCAAASKRGGHAEADSVALMDERMAEKCLEDDECEDDGVDGAGGMEDEEAVGGAGARMEIRKYRVVGTTNEYTEKQYFAGASLDAEPNYFWADAVAHFAGGGGAAGPLLTANFVYATGSVAEMVLAAALVGVGAEKPTHGAERVGQSLRVTAGGSCVVFSREIRERQEEKVDLDVLATQRMVDPHDLYTSVGGTVTLKAVTEFLVGKLYASRIVVTNATESELKLSLVAEVPQGAVPVVGLEYTENVPLVMAPLSTQTHELHFYFPAAGEFSCFPASVNKDGQLVVVARRAAGPLRVVRTRTAAVMETISDILNQGSREDILAFMEKANLQRRDVFTFDAIYWLLGDAAFYRDVVALLRRRQHFDATTWSYSVVHGDREALGEYLGWVYRRQPLQLRVVDGAAAERVRYVQCGLLQLDDYAYAEFSPLVNARAHDVGRRKHNIRNRAFREAYGDFLRYLFQKSPGVTGRDYVYWCTYLLLQDRVEEALRMHAAHVACGDAGAADGCGDAEDLRLQRDYLAAYLSLYTDAPGFDAAREIATRYLTYPVFTWRNRFIEVLNQVSGADAPGAAGAAAKAGGEDAVTDADRNAAQAGSEPYLSCELDGEQVRVTVSNVASVSVRFYRVDLEVLFSQNPFLDAGAMDYSYVAPNHTMRVAVRGALSQLTKESVAIPAELAAHNLIVQVGSGALASSVTYFPNRMQVVVNRNYGQVRVLDAASGAPLSLVYVKAFARRQGGEVGFFKDGYTDLRGTFEYASVHGGSGKLDGVEEFSLLVLSDAAGAVLTRAKPPSRAAEVTVGGARVRSAALERLQEQMVSEGKSKYCV